MDVRYNYHGNILLKSADEQTGFIRRMFDYDTRYLVLMSPFWKFESFYNKFIFEFIDALSKGVEIFIICKESDKEELSILFEANKREHLHIFGAMDFHAKLYFNDSVYLISSMNMSNFYGKDLGLVLKEECIGGYVLRNSIIDYISDLLNDDDSEILYSYFLGIK